MSHCDMAGQSGISVGGYVNSYGANVPTVFADQCSVPGAWSSIWMSCPAGDSVSSNYPAVGALLLQAGGVSDSAGGLKGRLNFLMPGGTSLPTHLITLGDSNPAKTLATPGHRPTNDPNDTWIGLDNPDATVSQFQLAFGAPKYISSYIGNTGDNTSWLERLTSTTKTFGNTIQIVSNLPTNSGVSPFSVASTVPVQTLVVSNHPLVQYCGALTTTNTCTATATTNGQIVFGSITFATGMTTITLTGISPPFQTSNVNCVANDLTNPGHGVNAAPQTGGSSVLFTGVAGSGGDAISYQCVGK